MVTTDYTVADVYGWLGTVALQYGGILDLLLQPADAPCDGRLPSDASLENLYDYRAIPAGRSASDLSAALAHLRQLQAELPSVTKEAAEEHWTRTLGALGVNQAHRAAWIAWGYRPPLPADDFDTRATAYLNDLADFLAESIELTELLAHLASGHEALPLRRDRPGAGLLRARRECGSRSAWGTPPSAATSSRARPRLAGGGPRVVPLPRRPGGAAGARVPRPAPGRPGRLPGLAPAPVERARGGDERALPRRRPPPPVRAAALPPRLPPGARQLLRGGEGAARHQEPARLHEPARPRAGGRDRDGRPRPPGGRRGRGSTPRDGAASPRLFLHPVEKRLIDLRAASLMRRWGEHHERRADPARANVPHARLARRYAQTLRILFDGWDADPVPVTTI